MPFLITEIVGACQSAHGFRMFGSGFVYQMNVKHNRLSLIIFNQYFRFIHIVTLTPPAMHMAMPCGDTMIPFCEGL